MSEILDLDIIVPPTRKVKLNGKILECHPLTLKQLLTLGQLEEKLKGVQDPAELVKVIKDTLSPIIPELKEEGFDISLQQMTALIEFLQKDIVPEDLQQVKQEYDPKKKSSSENPSQSS